MTRDDIIRMAREAGAMFDHMTWVERDLAPVFERFAALVAAAERERVMQVVQSMKADLEAKFEKTYLEGVVAGAAAEREACAQVCESIARDIYGMTNLREYGECAAAIRARGDKT